MNSGLYDRAGASATARQAACANWLEGPTTNVSNTSAQRVDIANAKVVWEGAIESGVTGTHKFQLYASNYFKLFADGQLKLDALLTRNSVEALSLRPGVEVIAQMKATALHVLRAT